MIHSNKFTISYSWYSIQLICQVCEVRDFGSGTVYSFQCTESESEDLSFLVSKAEAHWNLLHEKPEED